MASVALTSTWLSLASDLTKSLQLYATAVTETPGTIGEIRRYANGRTRSVSRAGTTRSFQCSFTLVANADVTTLTGWAGQVVLYRDPYGYKMFGTFYDLSRVQNVSPAVSEVSLTLTELTYSEAV